MTKELVVSCLVFGTHSEPTAQITWNRGLRVRLLDKHHSKMSLYGFGNEKHPIVLDIGHAYSKVGYGGEMSPRAIIPTIWNINDLNSEILLKHEAKLTKKTLVEQFTKFFDHVFFQVLEISPKDKWIVISESLMNISVVRESITEALLCFFDCSAVLFAPHQLLVCFTCAAETAVVIDSSYYETSVLPVVHNTPILRGWNAADVGSHIINETVKKSLMKDGKIKQVDGAKAIDFDILKEVVEDIKVQSCFVAPFERNDDILEFVYDGKERHGSPQDFEFIVKNKVLVVPGYVREESAEILFERNNDRMSIPYLVLDSILSCPMDVRKPLASNIIISGGTAYLPGFAHRLLSEVSQIVSQENKYKVLSECEFLVHDSPIHPNVLAWLGGSMLSTMNAFYKKSVTKDYFIKNNKRLADWCVLDLKPPELIIERPLTLSNVKKYVPSSYTSKYSSGRRSYTGTSSLMSPKPAVSSTIAPKEKQ